MVELNVVSKQVCDNDGDMLDSHFMTKLTICILILSSWYAFIGSSVKEINIILLKFSTDQPYKRARANYIKMRIAEIDANKKNN